MVERSAGLTPSEQILARFARRSFLSLWSHANVHRAPAKELCDLLVIFDEHIVIFSDKTCQFPEKPLGLAWSRWQRSTIDKSIEQLLGAERWIREHPNRLFLDVACTTPFPFAPPSNPRFHLVCIANGATERCRAELGGSGSLVQVCEAAAANQPFMVNVLRNDRVIHLLDEFTARLVFGELDTAPDFLAYLSAKEDLFLAGRLCASTGEENTLAAYLCSQPHLVPPGHEDSDRTFVFGEMLWLGVSSEEEYVRLQQLKVRSAAFDEWLDQIANLALSGDMYSGNEHGTEGHEMRLRVLAKTSRSERDALLMAGLSVFAGLTQSVPSPNTGCAAFAWRPARTRSPCSLWCRRRSNCSRPKSTANDGKRFFALTVFRSRRLTQKYLTSWGLQAHPLARTE